MLPRVVRLESESGTTILEVYGCDIAACHRCYTEGMGYFDFVVGKPAASSGQTICENDAWPMFLEVVVADTHIWRCPSCEQRSKF